MRIKTVCEATGLTDRTIRYYIEEEILFPRYTENYLGRRTFDFSPEDIADLRNIAVLRKFGYSVAEIRQMLRDPAAIAAVTTALRVRKESTLAEEGLLLERLSQTDFRVSSTVPELAAFLSAPVEQTPQPQESAPFSPLRLLVRTGPALLRAGLIWLPLLLAAWGGVISLRSYAYPQLDKAVLVLLLLLLTPSVAALLSRRTSTDIRRTLLVLCALSIPFSLLSLGLFPHSVTRDFRDYRKLDAQCIANRDSFFQALFPAWPHYFANEQQPDGSFETVWLDAHYYYHYFDGFDYTYDIYAEWPLEQSEFDREVTRVQALFAERAARNDSYHLETRQKGSYQCLIYYDGDAPFTQATTNYTYYIFAYDEAALRVRYIHCHSLENGADQPYYLSLQWSE